MKNLDATITEKEQTKYVTFLMNNETYGIDVMRAREVMYLDKITEVPDTLPFMKGVMDLRGKIIPLVDTRIKFKLDEKEYNEDTVIIIVEFENQIIGMIVDSVLDVASILSEEIQNTTHFSNEVHKDYIKGISKVDDELIIILDVDRIFTKEEFNIINTSEVVNMA